MCRFKILIKKQNNTKDLVEVENIIDLEKDLLIKTRLLSY